MNYNEVIHPLESGEVVRATKYISENQTLKATRKRFGKKITKGDFEIIVTLGRPNYVEREFIKLCRNSKEPFPVKKVQLKLYNAPAKSTRLTASTRKPLASQKA